ncbi:MAG: pyruvate kinase [candidate division Zixibacteria bacterium]|nr:pyruvate kinase [candidate division Zixibacteria bacterium]
MKKTKIIATYGPSVNTQAKVSKLIQSGVNLFRVNCSHGKTEDFLKAANIIRGGIKKANDSPVGILFDISGPKLRLGHFDKEVPVKPGSVFTLTSGKTDIQKKIISVNHPAIIKSIKKGERLFVDDGNIIFQITEVGKNGIKIKALNAGKLLSAKGVNLPDTDLKIPTITQKDKEDIKTAVRANVDYIALSFVRSGNDIIEAKKIIKRYGGSQRVIAKLEKKEAIQDIDEIMLLADGVMVARGDLGVELPPEDLPKLQKKIIKLANRHHKPVIVATQMMESMRFSPRATRAEINDVASAVFDFVDAVMLSAETATGEYPVEVVETMSNVIETTESDSQRPDVELETHLIKSEIPLAIAEAVSNIDNRCDLKLIFAYTTSGFTAELISNLFPQQPIIALTPNKKVQSGLSLYRSVYSVEITHPKSFNDMLKTVEKINREKKLVKKGDKVVITGGVPFGSTVATNFTMIHEIGVHKKS